MKSSLLLALLAAFTLSACGSSAPVEPTPTDDPVVEENTNNFVSAEFGFSLDFPENWDLTSTSQETTWAFGTAQTLYFKDVETGSDVFAVTRMTKEEWATVEGAGLPQPEILGEDNEYVWAYEVSQDVDPVTLHYLEELKEVRGTFQAL